MDPCTKHRVGGVCAADELPSNVSNLPKIFIANTDPSELPGQHWVCFYIPVDGPIEFFDSLGKHPRNYSYLFERFIYSHSDDYVRNVLPLQSDFSATCGHFCLFYAVHRCRGVSMSGVLNKFSRDRMSNDSIVRNFVKDHFGTQLLSRNVKRRLCQYCLSPHSLQ